MGCSPFHLIEGLFEVIKGPAAPRASDIFAFGEAAAGRLKEVVLEILERLIWDLLPCTSAIDPEIVNAAVEQKWPYFAGCCDDESVPIGCRV